MSSIKFEKEEAQQQKIELNAIKQADKHSSFYQQK